MSHQPMQNVTANLDAAGTRPVGDEKAKKSSKLKRFVALLLGMAVLLILPGRSPNVHAQSAICGQFTDVLASDVFCPLILQAFNLGITNGTSPTTFSPNDLVPRNQMVTFFDRGVDFTLHRGRRTAIGRTWAASSQNGGTSIDIGGMVEDVVTDGTFLWVARADSKIVKVNAADRRVLETWTIPAGQPRKLGVFRGLVWIADDLGNLYSFDPSGTAGGATQVFTNTAGIAGGFPTLAFDGTNVWWGSSSSKGVLIYPAASAASLGTFAVGAGNIDGLTFDGTFMWVLESDSHLLKMNIPTAAAPVPSVAETVTLPPGVSDCRMAWDGNNLWIPVPQGSLYVIRPSQGSLPSSIILNQTLPLASTSGPYVASFDGESIMIGQLNTGTVYLFKATSLTLIRSFTTGGFGTRGIASDGLTFNIGDLILTKLFQF